MIAIYEKHFVTRDATEKLQGVLLSEIWGLKQIFAVIRESVRRGE